MEELDVAEIICRLKSGEMAVWEIPREYDGNLELAKLEREQGVRITGKRGYDVISNVFFVEETLRETYEDGEEDIREIRTFFDNFREYYDFLEGNIYENACYAFCPEIESISWEANTHGNKLLDRKSFVKETIDQAFPALQAEIKGNFREGRKNHKICEKWLEEFLTCQTCEELEATARKYLKSRNAKTVDLTFFLFQYIFADVSDRQRFSEIMKYMFYLRKKTRNALCSIYDPEEVFWAFAHREGGNSTYQRYKRELKAYVQHLKKGEIRFETECFYDRNIMYYCIRTEGFYKENPNYADAEFTRYFDSFESFAEFRNGDLTNCDLRKMPQSKVDFSRYVTDETTLLPLWACKDAVCVVQKGYQDGRFYVDLEWQDAFGNVLEYRTHHFSYFFDFVAFLKGDLSGADLLFCDGLAFLPRWDSIDFSGARMGSSLLEKFGLEYEKQDIPRDLLRSFSEICKNEKETGQQLEMVASEQSLSQAVWDSAQRDHSLMEVHYISDLHLLHKIMEADCRSRDDRVYVIQKIVDSIAQEAGKLLLIGGDVASDFGVFQMFVRCLSQVLKRDTVVVFVLGNHELWSFPHKNIDEIAQVYREFLEDYGMYLLQNDLLYMEEKEYVRQIHIKKYGELCRMQDAQVVDCLRNASCVILGGLGFSGYNDRFHADNGIYRDTLDRAGEVAETKKFEKLYNGLLYILRDKNTIVLTHTPKKDWCEKESYDGGLIYISGHTHRNTYCFTEDYQVFSDNQVGYKNRIPHLKSFYISRQYDCFGDYGDGIFEITREQYLDFCRGKNISMTFQREINRLYMLKKNGVYCFICELPSGSLNILNGGAIKKLEHLYIRYYYDHMDAMVSAMAEPLGKYTAYQRQIAQIVQRVGGTGEIHGCIVDIDFLNHIYINPQDGTIQGYYAENIIDKILYPTIPDLLEARCPRLYGEYVRLLGNGEQNLPALRTQKAPCMVPEVCTDTEAYSVSRIIKKMQKLESHVLSYWDEKALQQELQRKKLEENGHTD